MEPKRVRGVDRTGMSGQKQMAKKIKSSNKKTCAFK